MLGWCNGGRGGLTFIHRRGNLKLLEMISSRGQSEWTKFNPFITTMLRLLSIRYSLHIADNYRSWRELRVLWLWRWRFVWNFVHFFLYIYNLYYINYFIFIPLYVCICIRFIFTILYLPKFHLRVWYDAYIFSESKKILSWEIFILSCNL